MDNEIIITIGEVDYHFKLKSQKIVELEKNYGKNIFEIIRDLSFSVVTDFMGASLISPVVSKYELMDVLLTKYSLEDLSNDIMYQIAVKSGLVKQQDLNEAMSDEEIKN